MNTRMEKRRVKLAWRILKEKAKYYGYADGDIISDCEYDRLESEYRDLCSALGKEPSAADAVGFPFSSPSGKLVLIKLKKT